MGAAATITRAVHRVARREPLIGTGSLPGQEDPAFRHLVGDAAWKQLPDPVRRRFSRRLAPDCVVLYQGQVIETRLNRAGRVLAWLGRLIGAPLPLGHGVTGPAAVAVAADAINGGQTWTRIYARSGRFPQVIQSAKRFHGPTGLEEHIGYGVSMALIVTVEAGALVFRSAGYAVTLAGRRLALPRWLEPGSMEIRHEQQGDGAFRFVLRLTHAVLGEMLHQVAVFRDVREHAA